VLSIQQLKNQPYLHAFWVRQRPMLDCKAIWEGKKSDSPESRWILGRFVFLGSFNS
jgi:hypothetical protein